LSQEHLHHCGINGTTILGAQPEINLDQIQTTVIKLISCELKSGINLCIAVVVAVAKNQKLLRNRRQKFSKKQSA